MSADSWKLAPGLNHVGAYQVSGQPFATGSVNCTTATKISFPYVTRWVIVRNRSATASEDLKVGFSQNGVEGTNYFVLPNAFGATSEDRSSIISPLELKVSEIWLSGSSDVDIVAGLTGIPAARTTTEDGTSWSGSAGVG